MPGLTDRQSTVIGTLFAAAPDAAVRQIEQALAEEVGQGGPLAEVHALAAREAAERRLRAAVLGPVVPLCRASSFGGRRFPAPLVPRLWSALRASVPELVAQAEAACLDPLWQGDRSAEEIYNELCAIAADGLRGEDRAFAIARGVLDTAGDDARAEFIAYLDATPLARRTAARLPQWLGRMTDDQAAAARLAYKDAVAESDEGGPRLVELLLAHLAEPWLILRVLAAVVVRANDRYLAESELGRFGDYVLADIDRRLAAFRAFDPDQGRPAGAAAAQNLHIAAQAVSEFENTLELSRDGPWGARVAQAKQALVQIAETRLGQIEKAVDQALPLQMVRFGKGLKGQPRLSADIEPRLLARAEGLTGFFEHCKTSAATFGFGAMRAKIGETLEARLDQYVEDLLEALRTDEAADPERIQAFLEAAAGVMGDIRGEKAAQIVRRRAAAAATPDPAAAGAAA